ncbi:MAG: exosortase K [Deltaproteobacteria bacterium]|jgi:exosortase K|nr:exosortase K [Deltaproteobacteria bacterium]
MLNAALMLKKIILKNLACYILVVFIAAGLKYHYSKAGSDALIWILAPTATLVELTSGLPFEYEAQAGFVNSDRRIIIAPSCAGVNFLLVAFCMAAFCGLHLFRRQVHKLLWLTASGLNAYFLTVVVNTLRIILSIYMYQLDIYGDWLTPLRLHRLTGIVIYFFFLCLFYMIINKGLYRLGLKFKRKLSNKFGPGHARSNSFRWPSITVTPLFWYALITLGVPLMNAAFVGNGARFAEHIGTVAGGCIVVVAAVFLLQWLWRRVKKYMRRFA